MLRRIAKRLSLGGQAGSMLIEVMVGAVLVVITSAAILDGLAGAQDTGQRNKARSVSASLAQQDQERMRAMPIEDISNYRNTNDQVKVANAPYTVVSRADWVRDASGVQSCTNDSTQAQYLKLTSTVTSNVQQNPPVTETSLMAPPRGTFGTSDGTAAVQVVDRDQNPIPGVRVDIDGPQSLSDTTNNIGCVVFGFIPEGPWTVSVTSLGLVGWDGNAPYQSDIGVIGGTTVLKKVELDEPSDVKATFNTLPLGASTPVAAQSKSISVNNAKLPSPGWKTYTQTTAQNSITAASLYPFLDGYGVYAGTCEPNNPTQWDSDYFTTVGTAAFTVPTPGQTSNVVARMPAINVEVQKSGATSPPLAGARIFVKNGDTDCTETYPSQLSNAVGAMPTPGFPWGEYKVCADDNAGHRSQVISPLVQNTNPAGTSKIVLKLPTTNTGNCNL
jgi:type II secretory pathway pseudopilin PulG